jgi:hypothetical protein
MRLQFVHVRPSFIVQRARPHPSPDAMWTRASSRTCWRDDALRVTGGPPTARWPDSVTQTVDRAIQTPSVIARAHAILRRWAYLVPSFLSPMEAQVIEDKRKARLCDECGHSAALHQVDGLGPCTAPGCECPILLPADDPEDTPLDVEDAVP